MKSQPSPVDQFLNGFTRRVRSPAFLRSFAVLLVAEAITMLTAWLMLDVNTNRWIDNKTARAARLSEQIASSADWSLIAVIPNGRDSALAAAYGRRLDKLRRQYFTHNEGSVYLVRVEKGGAYEIDPGDTSSDFTDKANQVELNAYAHHSTSFSVDPITDDYGTYVAAYTPIVRNRDVVGLVAVEYDEAPISDFRAIVRSAFWWSVVPAFGFALIVALVIAYWFVDPMDVLRDIDATAQSQHSSPSGDENAWWNSLTAREKEIVDLLRAGVSHTKDIASRLGLQPSSVETYIKRMKEKTGKDRYQLGIAAVARRTAPPQ